MCLFIVSGYTYSVIFNLSKTEMRMFYKKKEKYKISHKHYDKK